MGIPRKPGDISSQGGGVSRTGSAVATAGPFVDILWHAVDGGADLTPGEYELLIRSDVVTDVSEMTYASCTAAEQAALGAGAVGRSCYLNSPTLITIAPGWQRLSVRSLVVPPGAGYSVRLTPIDR